MLGGLSDLLLAEVRNAANPVFRFLVMVSGVPIAAFTECTLPTIEWEMETIREGGLNSYTHQLPGRRKVANVTLKNGVGMGLLLTLWYEQVMFELFAGARHTVTITLMKGPLQPLMVWNMSDCIPLKWIGPQLKSDSNTLAIQTLELACGEIHVVPAPPLPSFGASLPSKWVPKVKRVTNIFTN